MVLGLPSGHKDIPRTGGSVRIMQRKMSDFSDPGTFRIVGYTIKSDLCICGLFLLTMNALNVSVSRTTMLFYVRRNKHHLLWTSFYLKLPLPKNLALLLEKTMTFSMC